MFDVRGVTRVTVARMTMTRVGSICGMRYRVVGYGDTCI